MIVNVNYSIAVSGTLPTDTLKISVWDNVAGRSKAGTLVANNTNGVIAPDMDLDNGAWRGLFSLTVKDASGVIKKKYQGRASGNAGVWNIAPVSI